MAETTSILAFTDGAAKGNPGPGGWGAIIATAHGHVRELGGGAPHTTNNQMELTAPLQALRAVRELPGVVDLHTDSTYVIRGITQWMRNWKRRGWLTAEGKPVLNRDLWEALSEEVAARGRGGVKWHWVRGHTDVPGNERCDEIASAFATGTPVALYDGPLLRYPIPIHDRPEDTSLPARSAGGDFKKSAPAYSYLSVVDGIAMRHATWAECERRVKGVSGAKFKKAGSAADEATILHAWGVALGR
jgi:ribonuclease HI